MRCFLHLRGNPENLKRSVVSMINMVKLPTKKSNLFLRVAKGHFATSHSHINYYIDVTTQKSRLSEAKAVAKELVAAYQHSTIVDTVLCLDGTQVIGTCLGMMNESGNTVYIFPSMLNQALTKAGYSPRKTMKYLADKGLISMYREKNGKITYSTMRRFGDRSCRFVEFFIGKLAENKDPMDDLEDQMDQEEPPMAPAAAPFQTSATQTTMQDGFTVIDDMDDLPF